MLRANRGAVRLKRSLAYVTACLPLAIQADYAFPSVAPGSSASLYNLGWTFYYEDVLGTSLQLTLRTSAPEAVRAREAVLTSIDRDDKILSTWRSDSELSRWLDTRNRAGARLFRTAPSPFAFRSLAYRDRRTREPCSGSSSPNGVSIPSGEPHSSPNGVSFAGQHHPSWTRGRCIDDPVVHYPPLLDVRNIRPSVNFRRAVEGND